MFEFIVCLTILNASGSWRAMTLTIISAHIRARLIDAPTITLSLWLSPLHPCGCRAGL